MGNKKSRKSNTNWQKTKSTKNCSECQAFSESKVKGEPPFCATLLSRTEVDAVCDLWKKK